MTVADFLVQLQENGSVVVVTDQPPSPQEMHQCQATLSELDSVWRLNFPGDPPALCIISATWAAELFYRSCQFLVFREIPAEVVTQTLAVPFPHELSPSAVYSVDLVLRYLPDLLALAKGLSPEEPLVLGLLRLANEWPLSSVGVSGIHGVNIDSFFGHPSLRQLYIDRILKRRDLSRVDNPCVMANIRASIGCYPQLCPEFSHLIEKETLL